MLFPLRDSNSKTTHYLLLYSLRLNILKGTTKAAAVDILRLTTLRGTTTPFLIPKWYNEHLHPIYMGVLLGVWIEMNTGQGQCVVFLDINKHSNFTVAFSVPQDIKWVAKNYANQGVISTNNTKSQDIHLCFFLSLQKMYFFGQHK